MGSGADSPAASADARGHRQRPGPAAGDHPSFAAAVHTSVSGNPLLLDQLALELRREGVDPTAAGAARLAEVDATSVVRSVLGRLASLGAGDQAVARAVAVLGDANRIRTVAAVAEMDPHTVVAALGRLQRAEVLEPEGRAYAHAIVRDAVLGDVTAAERGLAHARAARALLDDGVAHERAALHLLEAPGTGRADVVAALRTAARAATARGAPQPALRFLRRALDEPVALPARAEVLAEAGHAALLAGDATATPLLREAAGLTSAADRATALTELAHARLFAGDIEGAIVAFDDAASMDADEEQRLQGEAGLTSALINVGVHVPEARRRLAAHADLPGTTAGQQMILAVCAFASARNAAPAAQTRELARRALGDGRLLAEQRSDSLFVHELAWALQFADAFDEADGVLSAVVEDARRRGAVAGFALAGFGRGWLRLRRGDLSGARADAESSLATGNLYRWPATRPLATAVAVEALVEQGEPAAAAVALRDAELEGEVPAGALFNLALHARGRLRLAVGRHAEGLADVLTAGERELALGGATPAGVP